MADNQSEKSETSVESEEVSPQKGLSKEAWTAISAIAVG
jgi:hypothetical protein